MAAANFPDDTTGPVVSAGSELLVASCSAPTAALSAELPASVQRLTTTLLTTQFAYVYDLPSQALVFVSAGVERLLGEQPDAAHLTPRWFDARLHPDDALVVTQTKALVDRYLQEHSTAALPHFLFSIDYRLRHANGHYCRVLQQYMLLERAPGPGPVQRIMGLFTDITAHKLTHEVRYHVNQPDFAAFAAQSAPIMPNLTAREQQVLALVLEGLTSRQIAHRLGLRELTVKTHRRNLLRKTGTSNFHTLLGHLGSA